jgi:hypothetical protein
VSNNCPNCSAQREKVAGESSPHRLGSQRNPGGLVYGIGRFMSGALKCLSSVATNCQLRGLAALNNWDNCSTLSAAGVFGPDAK